MNTLIKRDTFNNVWFGLCVLYLATNFTIPPELELSSLWGAIGALIMVTFSGLLSLFLIISRENILQLQFKQIQLIWWMLLLMFGLTILSQYPNEAIKTIIRMILYVPFIVSIVIVLNNIKRIQIITKTLIISTGIIAIQGILTNQGEMGFNLPGYLSDPNHMSLHLCIMIPFCYFYMIQTKLFFEKIICASIILLALIVIILSFSRGGFLALVCMVPIMFFFSPRKMLVTLMLIIGLAVSILVIDKHYINEMSTIGDTTESTSSARLTAWLNATIMFVNSPWGVGPRNSMMLMEQFEGNLTSLEGHSLAAHSIWFTTLADLGIFGIVLLLRLIYLNFKDLIVLKRLISESIEENFLKLFLAANLCSFVGFLVACSFLSFLDQPHFWYMTSIIAASSKILYSHIKISE